MIRRTLPLLALVTGLIVGGCGGDDSGETTTAPAVSIPIVTAPGVTTATTAPSTTSSAGTTVTSKGGTTYNPNQPDSATNDVPPAKGSPQAQFEKQCKQNPSACG